MTARVDVKTLTPFSAGNGLWTGIDKAGIDSISGTFTDGSDIVLSGLGFTTKTNPKPLLYWRADDGNTPSSLGRETSWDGSFNGSASTVKVLPNSTQAYRWDHSNSGAALAEILFTSDQLYIYRKIYEDFTYGGAVALRSRIDNVSGTFAVGETVTGGTSGATGIVQSISVVDSFSQILYNPTGGTINDASPTDFQNNEELTGGTSGATADNAESAGLFRTFNYKGLRIWNDADSNNTHVNMQGAEDPLYNITPENTPSNTLTTTSRIDTYEKEWKDEEVYYETSTLNATDGTFNFLINNTQGYASSQKFTSITTTWPNKYDQLFQAQVSNGAQPDTFGYYDTLYVDDTWHKVVVGDASTYTACREFSICIPSLWSDTSITAKLRQGGFASFTGKYIYVVTNAGTVVEELGHPL